MPQIKGNVTKDQIVALMDKITREFYTSYGHGDKVIIKRFGWTADSFDFKEFPPVGAEFGELLAAYRTVGNQDLLDTLHSQASRFGTSMTVHGIYGMHRDDVVQGDEMDWEMTHHIYDKATLDDIIAKKQPSQIRDLFIKTNTYSHRNDYPNTRNQKGISRTVIEGDADRKWHRTHGGDIYLTQIWGEIYGLQKPKACPRIEHFREPNNTNTGLISYLLLSICNNIHKLYNTSIRISTMKILRANEDGWQSL